MCIAGAWKVFWMKAMKDDNLKFKFEEVKIPSNCRFKEINPGISSIIPRLQHTHDCEMQSIQGTYVASTTLMLKAASILTKLLPKHNNAILDIKTRFSLMKNSLSLAGNVNQALNQYGVMLLDLLYHHSS